MAADRDWEAIMFHGLSDALRRVAALERHGAVLESRIEDVELWRHRSGAPLRDAVEIRSPGGWRTRARALPAVILAALITLAVALWTFHD